MPTSKAFVTRRILASLTKETMTRAFVSNFLICSKAYSSLVPHFLDLPMHVRSHKRLDIVEIPRRADPGKLPTLDWFWGFGASTVASTLLLEICSPSPVSTSPLYSKLSQPMYSKLSPCSSNLRITLSRFSSCFLWSQPSTLTLSCRL